LNVTRVFAFVYMFIMVAATADQKDISKLQPTPEMIREAEKNPGGWVYAIAGTYGQNYAVPPEAIAGAWEVDDNGKIIPGSFKANPNYKKKLAHAVAVSHGCTHRDSRLSAPIQHTPCGR
jgi:hypothetical protein